MRKFLALIILLAVSATAQAQYATVPIASRAGCRIKLDNEKLTPAQSAILMQDVGGEDMSAQWKNARGWRTAGISMIAGGGGLAVVGAGTALLGAMISMTGAAVGATAGAVAGSIGGKDTAQQTASSAAQKGADAGKPYMTAGLIIAAVGIGVQIAGIPITVVNSTRMSRLIDRYNDSVLPSPELLPESELAPEVQLSFCATGNGVGITLNF